MSYVNRHPTKKRSGSAELLYLFFVLAAGIATAWWAGHKIGADLSSVTAVASILGLTETGRVAHGAAGYQPAVAVPQAGEAPYCGPAQAPTFAVGLGVLKQQLGDAMGAPIECEHPNSPTGDTIQQTTTGLAAYNKLTNTVMFTDGWRYWALTAGGLVTWEGLDASPPAANSSPGAG